MIKKYDRFKALWGKPVRERVSLRDYTSFSIGGRADLFVSIRNEEDLIHAVKSAVKSKVPYVVIGMGTNVLASDEGFRGVVIRNCSRRKPRVEDTRIWAPSHVSLASVVEEACRHSLAGMEFATGIPGTVGGAVYINAGAFGSSLADRAVSGKVLTPAGEVLELKNADFEFDYRSSRLKRTRETAVGILLQLEPGKSDEIRARMEEIRALRAQKHPERKSYNAGSYFKNLPPEEPGGRRQAAGKFLELAGAKGLRKGHAVVYQGHANFIVNEGRATAADVLALAEQLKRLVHEKFQIRLEEEVRFLDAEKGFKIGG